MRAVSRKRARVMRRRREVVAELRLERGGACELRIPGVCRRYVDGAHELVGRAQGGSLVDPRGLLLCCSACNTHVEDRPAMAYATGRKCRRYDAVDGDGGLIPSPEWLARHRGGCL